MRRVPCSPFDSPKSLPRRGTVVTKLLVVAVIAAVAAWAVGLPPRSAGVVADQPPVLLAGPAQLDFGAAWSSDDFVCTVPVRNISAEPVSVIRVAAGCGCTSIGPKSFDLAPGAAQDLTLHLDLRPLYPVPEHIREWPFQETIAVYFGDADSPQYQEFPLSGRVRETIAVPRIIQYVAAERLVEHGPTPSRTVPVRTSIPLRELRVDTDWWYDMQPTVAADPDRPGDYLLTIVLRDDMDAGEFDFDLRLTPVAADGEVLPAVPVIVRGVKEPDCYAIPSEVRFVYGAGEVPSATVTLATRSGREFFVGEIAAEGYVIEPPASDTAGRHVFTVSLVPSAAAPLAGTIKFLIFAADGASRELDVPIACHRLNVPVDDGPLTAASAK